MKPLNVSIAIVLLILGFQTSFSQDAYVQAEIEGLTMEMNYLGSDRDILNVAGEEANRFFVTFTKNTYQFKYEISSDSKGNKYLRGFINGKWYELAYTRAATEKLGYGRYYATWSPMLNSSPIIIKSESNGTQRLYKVIDGKQYELNWSGMFANGKKDEIYKRKAVVWHPQHGKFTTKKVIGLRPDEELDASHSNKTSTKEVSSEEEDSYLNDAKEWTDQAYDDTKEWGEGAVEDVKEWGKEGWSDTKDWIDGAIEDTGNEIHGKKLKEGERAIAFNNQAGYYAYLQVMYFEDKKVGETIIPSPVVKETGKIGLGITRRIVIPDNIRPEGVIVNIIGVGTISEDVYQTKVSSDFTGEKCFKSWGTFLDTEGGPCN